MPGLIEPKLSFCKYQKMYSFGFKYSFSNASSNIVVWCVEIDHLFKPYNHLIL